MYDAVALQGEEVRLKAETRGTVFIKGGELVEFFVDDASLGKNLSGGDGAAYRLYKASRPGLKNIRAVSRKMTGTGYLLVLKPGAGVVAVDVEGSLLQGGFMSPGRPESREAARVDRKALSPDLSAIGGDEPESGPLLAAAERIHRRSPSSLGRRHRF